MSPTKLLHRTWRRLLPRLEAWKDRRRMPLARIEAELAQTRRQLESLQRIERQLSHSSLQIDFLSRHGASYLGAGIALTHLPDETPIFINSNDYGSPMNFLSGGRYEDDNLDVLLSFVDESTCFVDVGANLGYFALRIAQRLRDSPGRVLAFEPQPGLVELMRRTLHLNGLSHRVEVFPCALSDRDGSAVLEMPVGHLGGAHIPTVLTARWQGKQSGATERREIELRSLDGLMPGDFRCDLVKIDVEGHELSVLRGMRQTLARSPRATVLFEKMIRSFGDETGIWDFCAQLGMAVYGVGEAATLVPLHSAEALARWDRGYALATRDPEVARQLNRRRFRITPRQLHLRGDIRLDKGSDGPAVDIEGREVLAFGPYWSLSAGRWRLRLSGHLDAPIDVLIKARVGQFEIARLRLEPGRSEAEFHCEHELVKFECVLHTIERGLVRLRLQALHFERIDGPSPDALRAAEAAANLAEPGPPVLVLPPVEADVPAQSRAKVSTRRLPRVAVVSNCQGGSMSLALQAFLGGRVPPVHYVGWASLENPALLVPPLRELAAHHDTVLVQPTFAKRLLPLVPDLAAQIALFPAVRFTAFHPDLCYVIRREPSERVSGPMGPYHSSIAFHAWRAGMSTREALEYFDDETYQALRFHDYWDAARRTLLDEGLAADLPLDALLERWQRSGCFMHTHNHPKISAVADVARAVLERQGIELPALDPGAFLHDPLAGGEVWPVYPELAKRLGIAGSYQFKATNGDHELRSPVRLLDLETLVEQSFQLYDSYGRDALDSDRAFSARYAAVFGANARRRGRIVVPENAGAPTRPHPYQDLPAYRFWRQAVSERRSIEVDPVRPRFTIPAHARIATAGSCFAQHISRALARRGCGYLVAEPAPAGLDAADAAARQYGLYSARYGNLYTARQLLQLLRRATGREVSAEPAWQRPDGRWADPFRPSIEPEGFATIEDLEADRRAHLAAVREMFAGLDVFVFTLGLTEAWVSRVDGAVFPIAPGVIAGSFDPARHAFVNFDVADVVADLEAFVTELRALNPTARLVLTVSPVPLAATFEDCHVLTATTASKAVLRAAAQALCTRTSGCDYFPSYEIVTGPQGRGIYYAEDLRTITVAGVEQVMRLFFRHYVPDAPAAAPDAELLEEARQLDRVVCEESRLDAGARH